MKRLILAITAAVVLSGCCTAGLCNKGPVEHPKDRRPAPSLHRGGAWVA